MLVARVGIVINWCQLSFNNILINLSEEEFVAYGAVFMLKSPKGKKLWFDIAIWSVLELTVRIKLSCLLLGWR